MMFHPEYLAAFGIGFLGSLHCLGMCGPIALVVPPLGTGSIGRVSGGLIYNSGRILTYSMMGLLAGIVGKGFAVFNWQQGISIVLGVLIVIYGLLPGLFNNINISSPLYSFSNRLKNSLSSVFKKRSVGGSIGIGMLNGLLPCGLVYVGLAGSLDLGSAVESTIFMACFGLGTLPMMTGVNLLGNNLKGTMKNRIARILPVFTVMIGLVFILRGLGLGIPYLSPSMNPHSGSIECTSPAHRHPN